MSPSVVLEADRLARAMVANVRWAARLGWDRYGEALAILFGCPWAGPGDAQWAHATATWQRMHDLSVDGIIGKDTWKALSKALAPDDSFSGVVPPDAPPVPEGFEGVLATFGDPRPLLNADGLLSEDNDVRWQRQTLASAVLPFPIPHSSKDPGAGIKKRFSAHRKLVTTFVAVFTEIDRLGLRDHIQSWGGIYNFRPIRGAKNISLHAFGAAIDLNSETNPLGGEGTMNAGIVEIFEHFGFFWGGNFRTRPDPMHFQYAVGY
jgi:hypothetical protein